MKSKTITLQTGYKGDIYLKFQTSEDFLVDDEMVDVIVSVAKPEDGEDFFWKKLSVLQLGGIFNGRNEATLTINELGKVTEVK